MKEGNPQTRLPNLDKLSPTIPVRFIPEIALKASLTYRSEIDHKAETYEEFQVAGKYAALTPTGKTTTAAGLILGGLTQLVGNPINSEFTITTPKSVNVDFQTGIYADTIAFANIRWVNWKDFTLRPYAFNLASTFIGKAATGGRIKMVLT